MSGRPRKSKKPTKDRTTPARKPRSRPCKAKGPAKALDDKASATIKASPAPTQSEQDAIAAARLRAKSRESRIALKVERRDGSVTKIGAPHSDQDGWDQHLRDTFGTSSRAFAEVELARLLTTLGFSSDDATETVANSALAVLDGAHPRSEIEAMLVAQMAGTHVLAMEMMGRTKRAKEIPQFEANGNMAVKMLRTFTAQAEALAKLRRGGEQTVRVEHVHVYPGGKAVVGTVNNHQASPGDRGRIKNCEQPHATDDGSAEAIQTVTYAPGVPLPALWSENPEREPMPVAGGQREGPLQDARRS